MGESRPDIQHRKERIVSRGRSGWGWFRFPWRSADDDCLVVPKPRSIDESFDVAALSDVGTVRSNNEDAVGVFKDLGLVVLADGMGGHERGEVASQLAIETVRQVCRGDVEVLGKKNGESAAERLLAAAACRANQRLYAENTSRQASGRQAMGTTLTALWLLDGTPGAAYVHVGDSRLYCLSGGRLRQISKDQTLHQMWLDGDRQSQEPQRNIVTQAVGVSEAVEPEVWALQGPEAGDAFLLCSDGVSDVLEDACLERALVSGRSAAETCSFLVDEAKIAGSKDNVSVVVLYVRE